MDTNGSEGKDTRTSHEARLAIVEKHVRRENQHDLEGVMATFGENAGYHDEPWSERHEGRDSVRAYYEGLLRALPDLRIDVQQRHVTDEHVILEVVISGTHIGAWRGLPGTGRHVEFPLCAVYAFDDQGKLAWERIYYDRATVLQQIGIFRDPDHGLGRILTPLTHPAIVARALARKLRQR